MWPFSKPTPRQTLPPIEETTILDLPLGRKNRVIVTRNTDGDHDITIQSCTGAFCTWQGRDVIARPRPSPDPEVPTTGGIGYDIGRLRAHLFQNWADKFHISCVDSPKPKIHRLPSVGLEAQYEIQIVRDNEDPWLEYWTRGGSHIGLSKDCIYVTRNGSATAQLSITDPTGGYLVALTALCVGGATAPDEAFLFEWVFPYFEFRGYPGTHAFVDLFHNACDGKTYARLRSDNAIGYSYIYEKGCPDTYVPIGDVVMPENLEATLLADEVDKLLTLLRGEYKNYYAEDVRIAMERKLTSLLVSLIHTLSRDQSQLPDLLKRLRSAVRMIPSAKSQLDNILSSL